MSEDDVYTEEEDSIEIKEDKIIICNCCNSDCNLKFFTCESCLLELSIKEFNYYQCSFCNIKMVSCDMCSKVRKHQKCKILFIEYRKLEKQNIYKIEEQKGEFEAYNFLNDNVEDKVKQVFDYSLMKIRN